MNRPFRPFLIAVALAVFAAPGLAGQQAPGMMGRPGSPRAPGDPRGAEDWLGRFLYPPELVMQQQDAIGLKPEQRTAITQAIKELQGKVVDLQWQLQEEAAHLGDLLDKPVVDQAATLAQVDKLLSVEREVKRAHITLLVQIKNQLTAAQQAKLSAARAGS